MTSVVRGNLTTPGLFVDVRGEPMTSTFSADIANKKECAANARRSPFLLAIESIAIDAK